MYANTSSYSLTLCIHSMQSKVIFIFSCLVTSSLNQLYNVLTLPASCINSSNAWTFLRNYYSLKISDIFKIPLHRYLPLLCLKNQKYKIIEKTFSLRFRQVLFYYIFTDGNYCLCRSFFLYSTCQHEYNHITVHGLFLQKPYSSSFLPRLE